MSETTPVNPILGRIVYEQILKVQRALVRDRKIHVFEVLLPETLIKPFLRHVGALPGEWNAGMSCMIGDNGAYLKVTEIPSDSVLASIEGVIFCTPVGRMGFPLENSAMSQRLAEIDLMVSGLKPYETIEESETPAEVDGVTAADPVVTEGAEGGEGSAQAPVVVQGSGLPAGGTDTTAESVSGGESAAEAVPGFGASSA